VQEYIKKNRDFLEFHKIFHNRKVTGTGNRKKLCKSLKSTK
jgi:hypothetical protein